MSRRDTIIVAVLLNTGLLAVLFMMAINTDDERTTTPSEVLTVNTTEPFKVPIETDTHIIAMATSPVSTTTQANSGDELDNVLKDYAANIPPQTIVLDDDNADSIEKEPAQEPKSEAKSEKAVAYKSPTTSSDGKTVDVTVKKGDSLDKIARANGTTVDALKKASSLKNDKLKVGQVLKVPVGSKKADAKPVAAKKEKEETKLVASNETEYYMIQKGDNPWKIAKQFKVKFDDLLKLNNLDEEKARNLKVGDKIRVK